jgi:hypothetical protein
MQVNLVIKTSLYTTKVNCLYLIIYFDMVYISDEKKPGF